MGRHLRLVDDAVHRAFFANFLDVAQRFFFDGGQAAGDIAFGRLRVRQVAGFVTVNHVLVAVEHEHELLTNGIAGAALGDYFFTAGDLRGFAEAQVVAQRVQLVKGVADRRVGAAAGGGVGLAAFGGDPQFGDAADLALLFTGPLHILARGLGGAQDGVVVAVAFNAKAHDRLARRGDAVDHFFRPAVFDPDDDDGRHIGVAAGADQRAEVQLQVGAKLQPAIGMRNRHRALDVVGHGFGGGIG